LQTFTHAPTQSSLIAIYLVETLAASQPVSQSVSQEANDTAMEHSKLMLH